MKKIYFALMAATSVLSSCITSTKTATTMDIHPSVRSVTVADLDVAPERITYRMVPSKAIQRGGIENVKQAAENEALQKNGNADILVEPQFVYAMKNGRVKSIEVTGRPAYYKNFRSLPDTVWSNPYFNGLSPVVAAGSGNGGGGLAGLGKQLGSWLGGGKHSAEKAEKPKKVRNPFRSTGFHAYFEIGVGPTTQSGASGYYVPTNYDVDNGGYTLTLGAQIDEQLYLGIGGGLFGVYDEDDNRHFDDYYLGNDNLSALTRFFSAGWWQYSYITHKEQDLRVSELIREGEFSFQDDAATEMLFVPIYANARYYFSPKKVSPFLDLKLGYSPEVSTSLIHGGLYFSPSIGIGLRRLHFSLKYAMQGAGYSGKFKNEIDDFFNTLNSCNNAQWESGTYVQYYDYLRRINVQGDRRTESEFLDLLRDFRSNTSWLLHNFSICVGFRF